MLFGNWFGCLITYVHTHTPNCNPFALIPSILKSNSYPHGILNIDTIAESGFERGGGIGV